ncbi:hypothetical protein GCM10027175_35780 [Hymenobacter latericoloratus]
MQAVAQHLSSTFFGGPVIQRRIDRLRPGPGPTRRAGTEPATTYPAKLTRRGDKYGAQIQYFNPIYLIS